ncbi:DUF4374 domain-containing protein [Marinilongibacter aquaticus]|uniref:DUF4374 domain-containing protein n=1 Tax=Marinilongibacter aquaticus TaxID=2975157 RepID=UPI0021BD53F3|nr:DUF4374 domain-containing protein [Marinilongibacter aquaticus]UBM60425.1 DUF4374 domain-containing protein [Marinilongibacter aquaticus]
MFTKQKAYLTVFAGTLLSSVIFSSCTDSSSTPDPGTDPVVETESKYFLSLRTQGSEGTSDYVLSADVIDDENTVISAAGKGIEQLGWCYYQAIGNTFFSFSYGDANKGIGYGFDKSGNIYEKGSFAYERIDLMGKGDDETLIGIGAPWGGGSFEMEVQLIDNEDIGIKKKVSVPMYKYSDADTLSKWPTSVLVRGDKMYMSFYPLDGASWATPETDTAYVAVYSYPEIELQTVIKDTRMGPIGYYGSPTAMVKDENENIYAVSSSAIAAGYTSVTKHSGILRINNGEDSFDSDFFIDVEEATNGGKLLSVTYAGNGKLVGRMVSAESAGNVPVWAAFDELQPICQIVVIDLDSKSVEIVDEIPMHSGQYTSPSLIEDGKVYMNITSLIAGESRLYKVDPATATATKAAKIEGLEVPALYKFEYEVE